MSALWDQYPVNVEPEKTRRGAEALLLEREPLASLSHACPAVGSTLGGFCCFQTSGALSLDTHAALPLRVLGNHFTCNVILQLLRDSAHFLSVSIQDVMERKKRQRTNEAK